jgi:hypothetical protein
MHIISYTQPVTELGLDDQKVENTWMKSCKSKGKCCNFTVNVAYTTLKKTESGSGLHKKKKSHKK